MDFMFEALSKSIGPLATLVIIANCFIVWKLYVKMDAIDKKLPVQDTVLESMGKDIASFDHKIEALWLEMKDIGSLRERIAVLEDRSIRK